MNEFKFQAYYIEPCEGPRRVARINPETFERSYFFDTFEEAKAALEDSEQGLGGYILEARVVFEL